MKKWAWVLVLLAIVGFAVGCAKSGGEHITVTVQQESTRTETSTQE